MRRLSPLFVLLLTVWLLPQGVAADQEDACDRQCRIEIANTYLAALVSNDGSDVPFHPDAWRKENGAYSGRSGEEIRESLSHPIMWIITGIRDLRWYAEGDDVVAIFLLDTSTPAPTYIIERFRIVDGLIHEIEAHFYIDFVGYTLGPESPLAHPDGVAERLTESNHGPLGPVPIQDGNTGDDADHPDPVCEDPETGEPAEDLRACVAAAVEAFLAAMVGRDVSSVPLAAHVTYEVNRRAAAADDEEVRALLSDEENGITGLELITLVVDGDQAVAHYVIELGDTRSYGAARFHVPDGRIAEVEAVCSDLETCTDPQDEDADDPPLPDPGALSSVVAGPGGIYTGYLTPVTPVQEGGSATFMNADTLAPHNVVGTAPGGDGRPLFAAPT